MTELDSLKQEVQTAHRATGLKQEEVEQKQRQAEEWRTKQEHLEKEMDLQREEQARKRRELQKQVDFLVQEQNQRELELSDARDKLKKREDEVRELKTSLNS